MKKLAEPPIAICLVVGFYIAVDSPTLTGIISTPWYADDAPDPITGQINPRATVELVPDEPFVRNGFLAVQCDNNVTRVWFDTGPDRKLATGPTGGTFFAIRFPNGITWRWDQAVVPTTIGEKKQVTFQESFGNTRFEFLRELVKADGEFVVEFHTEETAQLIYRANLEGTREAIHPIAKACHWKL